MADRPDYTLQRMLPDRLNHLRDAIEAARDRDGAAGARKLPGAALAVAEKRVSQKVLEALRPVSILDVIARAWSQAPELREAAASANRSVSKTSVLHLGEHDLDADLLPIADISFVVFGKVSVEFTLTLSIGLTTAEVTIADGHIVKIGKTEGQVSASLSCGPLSLSHPIRSKILIHDEVVLRSPVALAPSVTEAA